MSEKKELKNEELNEVSGGQGINNTIVMTIGLTFKITQEDKDLYSEIELTFNKKFTTKVSDKEIEDACKDWCKDNYRIYVGHTVIRSRAY